MQCRDRRGWRLENKAFDHGFSLGGSERHGPFTTGCHVEVILTGAKIEGVGLACRCLASGYRLVSNRFKYGWWADRLQRSALIAANRPTTRLIVRSGPID